MSKKQISNFIAEVLKDLEAYSKNSKKMLSEIKKNNQQIISISLQACNQIFKDSKVNPYTKLNALRFVKDCIDTNQQEIINLISENILAQVADIAKFKHEEKDLSRGVLYFSNKPDKNQQKCGNSLVRLALECILIWGQRYPQSKYEQAYKKVKTLGTFFPTELNYFKKEKIQNSSQLDQSSYKQDQDNYQNSQTKILLEIDQNLERIKGYKEFLQSLLIIENEYELEKKTLQDIIEELNKFSVDTQKFMNEIFTMSQEVQEKYLQLVLSEQEEIQFINDNYLNYQSENIDYSQFRQNILHHIFKQEELHKVTPTPNIQDQQEKEYEQKENKKSIEFKSNQEMNQSNQIIHQSNRNTNDQIFQQDQQIHSSLQQQQPGSEKLQQSHLLKEQNMSNILQQSNIQNSQSSLKDIQYNLQTNHINSQQEEMQKSIQKSINDQEMPNQFKKSILSNHPIQNEDQNKQQYFPTEKSIQESSKHRKSKIDQLKQNDKESQYQEDLQKQLKIEQFQKRSIENQSQEDALLQKSDIKIEQKKNNGYFQSEIAQSLKQIDSKVQAQSYFEGNNRSKNQNELPSFKSLFNDNNERSVLPSYYLQSKIQGECPPKKPLLVERVDKGKEILLAKENQLLKLQFQEQLNASKNQLDQTQFRYDQLIQENQILQQRNLELENQIKQLTDDFFKQEQELNEKYQDQRLVKKQKSLEELQSKQQIQDLERQISELQNKIFVQNEQLN